LTSNSAQQPGVSRSLVRPADASKLVERALSLSPDITVVGIAGPGDTLATPHAIETFRIIHRQFPQLINCMSTNGLLLERHAEELVQAGVKTLTVTVNAVDPVILKDICSFIVLDGKRYDGEEGASLLIEAQKRGIALAAKLGLLVKINTVLIPPVNGRHIAEIAETVAALGAEIFNIIPLIPSHEFAAFVSPSCEELAQARNEADAYLSVFRHCQHCRADACGIPGKTDLSALLYGEEKLEATETFSHG
jgi:nitrogen fixation protein NifB